MKFSVNRTCSSYKSRTRTERECPWLHFSRRWSKRSQRVPTSRWGVSLDAIQLFARCPGTLVRSLSSTTTLTATLYTQWFMAVTFGLLRLRVVRTELHHDRGFDERLLVPLVVLPQLLALRCSFRAPMTAGRWSSPPHSFNQGRRSQAGSAQSPWAVGYRPTHAYH